MQLINRQFHAFHAAQERIDRVDELLIHRNRQMLARGETRNDFALLLAEQGALIVQHGVVQCGKELLRPCGEQVVQTIFDEFQASGNGRCHVVRGIEMAMRAVRRLLQFRCSTFVADLDGGHLVRQISKLADGQNVADAAQGVQRL